VPINIAFLRGTTADEDSNITMEEEAVFGEMLAMAQAARRAGGVIDAGQAFMPNVAHFAGQNKSRFQFWWILSLSMRRGDADLTHYDRYSGELRIPVGDIKPAFRSAQDHRASRCDELFPGNHLGAGISTGAFDHRSRGLLDLGDIDQRAGLIGGAPSPAAIRVVPKTSRP
jgi:propionate CoA-transferase